MNKQQLRKQYIAKRFALTDDEYAGLNLDIFRQFRALLFEEIKCIHTFLPMMSRKEPDTRPMINWLKSEHPNIKLAYPKSNFAEFTMTNFLDDIDLKIATSTNGITEPISGNQIELNEIDMIIVPLLVFDTKGYRVGYGKGFYDRLMAQFKPTTRFIGLSLFDPIDSIENVDQYDIPLHQCITPEKIWTFS